MKRKAKVTIYNCDNPACGHEAIAVDGGELPTGIYISGVTLIWPSGGGGAREVYACTDQCLAAAVQEAVDRS